MAATLPTRSALLRRLSPASVMTLAFALAGAAVLAHPGPPVEPATASPDGEHAPFVGDGAPAAATVLLPGLLPIRISSGPEAAAAGAPGPGSAGAPPVPPSASPRPAIVDRLISADGTLSTRVGIYSDCTGRTPLPRGEAEIDVCMTGPVYFLGHNPGVFRPLMHQQVGSLLTWFDHSGGVHRYRVVAVRDLPADASRRPTQRGVAAQFQTCVVPDGSIDRILDAVAG